jgi:hypothetical protein
VLSQGGAALPGILGVGATTGAIIGGAAGAASDSPLGRAVNLTETGASAYKGFKDLMADKADSPIKDVPFGSSAMERRALSLQEQPDYVVHQGIKLLDDKDLELPYEVRAAAFEPLLRAKYKQFNIGQVE